MSNIRTRATSPELRVRKAVRSLGYRFQTNVANLPGRPDLVLHERKIIIFVHGCFWHRHHGCRLAYIPKTRKRFWVEKFKANIDRDKRAKRELRSAGWQVVVVWECQIRANRDLAPRLKKMLGLR